MKENTGNTVENVWHEMAAERAIDALHTDSKGLSSEEAATRLETHGPNRLPEPARRSPLVRFLLHFHNILIYVLLGSAAITAALGHLADTLVILAVVVANAIYRILSGGQGRKSDGCHPPHACPESIGACVTVCGIQLKARALVPGDIVLLEAGDKVPADLRLLRT